MNITPTQNYWVVISISLATVFVANSFCFGQQVEVELVRSKVSTANNLVTIGDVANVSRPSSRIAKKILSLDLANFVFDQNEINVSKDQIRMRIIVSGITPAEFRLHGENELVVTKMNPKNVRSIIESKVADEMSAQFSIEKKDIKLALLPVDYHGALANLSNHIDSVTTIFPTDLPPGNAKIKFLFLDGGQLESVELAFHFSIQHTLVVATRAIRRGETITVDTIKQVRRPLLTANFAALRLKDCIGMVAAKDIAAHSILQSSQVASARKTIRLKRNDRVDVISRHFGSTFRIPNAKVLESAGHGDVVSVANPESNTVIRAIVVDNSTVELR